MRELSLTVTEELAGRTVKSLLSRELCMSDSHISRIKFRERGILLDGCRVHTDRRVSAGQVLEAQIGDDPPKRAGSPTPYPLPILYEDADILILDKPAGLSVHSSTRDPGERTVEGALLPLLSPEEGIHPVSRLDRGTTGLMTVAKNGYMHERLRRMLHTPEFTRSYLGIAVGRVTPESGVIDAPTGFAQGSFYKRAVREDGVCSVTRYETVKNTERFTLLRLLPQTGRMHQLRVHMSYLGYPLAGDWLYGCEDRELIARPALHSREITLVHPLSGERICVVSPLPEDMERLLTL